MNLFQVWFSDNGSAYILFGTYGDLEIAKGRARNIRLACKSVKVTQLITVATFEPACCDFHGKGGDPKVPCVNCCYFHISGGNGKLGCR